MNHCNDITFLFCLDLKAPSMRLTLDSLEEEEEKITTRHISTLNYDKIKM